MCAQGLAERWYPLSTQCCICGHTVVKAASAPLCQWRSMRGAVVTHAATMPEYVDTNGNRTGNLRKVIEIEDK